MSLIVQYATTEDGVKIAYAAQGRGPPLVCMPLIYTISLEQASEIPALAMWPQRPFVGRTQVIYSVRGIGHSAGSFGDVGLETDLLDLGGVIQAIGGAPVALFAPLMSGPAAISYAVRHPHQVTHLILWSTSARLGDMADQPRARAVVELRRAGRDAVTQGIAVMLLGLTHPEQTQRFRELHELEPVPDHARVLARAAVIDVSDQLDSVRAPTLVLERRSSARGAAASLVLARNISNARLSLVDAESAAPFVDTPLDVLGLIEDFFDTPTRATRTLDDAVAGSVNGPGTSGGQQAAGRGLLTPREIDVLRLVARGRSNQEIADELTLSVRTVERHLSNLYSRLGIHSRSQATAVAINAGLV